MKQTPPARAHPRVPGRPAVRGAAPGSPVGTPLAALVAAVLTVGALGGCAAGGYRTLDRDGVTRAIVTEGDFPDRDGWTSTGISSESSPEPAAQTALTTATGMPQPCRDAFAAWADTDRERKAGVNNNFTKFSLDDLKDAVMVQLAVRSFDHPPGSRAGLREVVSACSGTMTLKQRGVTNDVTIEPNPLSTSDAEGLRITMDLDGQSTVLVTAVAERGQNLAQVVGIGRADRDVPDLVQRVLDVQVKKLEETAS